MKQKDLKMAKKENKAQAEQEEQPIDSELQNIIEAALFAAKAPLGVRKIMSLFPDDAQPSKVDIQNVLLALEEQCEHRGIELRRIGNGWRFQSKEKYSPWLRKLRGDKAPKYSRALLETLSIIAYRQPVTRGDIEDIRGVGVSSDTIRILEERDWIGQIGHRDVPGRPALFGTTQGFLEYFNMESLRELPELMEKRAMGEIAKDMNLTLPMDGVKEESDVEADQGESASAEVIELRPQADNGEVDETEESVVTDSDVSSASDGVAPDDSPEQDETLNDEQTTEASGGEGKPSDNE